MKILVEQKLSKKTVFTLQAFSQYMTVNIFFVLIPAIIISEWATQLWTPLGIELYAILFLSSWAYILGAGIDMEQTEKNQGKVSIRYRHPSGYQNHIAITFAGILVRFIACEIALSCIGYVLVLIAYSECFLLTSLISLTSKYPILLLTLGGLKYLYFV